MFIMNENERCSNAPGKVCTLLRSLFLASSEAYRVRLNLSARAMYSKSFTSLLSLTNPIMEAIVI